MPRCAADAVSWKNRRAYRLSNGTVELTVLTGGGHLADFRLSNSPMNAIWEAPWPTIEPWVFSSSAHASIYGDGPVGRFLSSYTGHALVVGNFGMPTETEAAHGVALHGEAASSEWIPVSTAANDLSASIVIEVMLPVYKLRVRREIMLKLDSFTVSIREIITNLAHRPTAFQWVQHAAFGEPLLASGESSLFLSGSRAITWPLGYEGHELLPDSEEFQWPSASSINGEELDLSSPFLRHGTGFVASILTDSDRNNGFIAVHNRHHALVAGYVFDRMRFPWIALWEENCARGYAPWNGATKVRGVEFGNSPMPLGLDHALKMPSMFDTPTFTTIAADARLETSYQLFISPVPAGWTIIQDVAPSRGSISIKGDANQQLDLY